MTKRITFWLRRPLRLASPWSIQSFRVIIKSKLTTTTSSYYVYRNIMTMEKTTTIQWGGQWNLFGDKQTSRSSTQKDTQKSGSSSGYWQNGIGNNFAWKTKSWISGVLRWKRKTSLRRTAWRVGWLFPERNVISSEEETKKNKQTVWLFFTISSLAGWPNCTDKR